MSSHWGKSFESPFENDLSMGKLVHRYGKHFFEAEDMLLNNTPSRKY